jgi:hypothetical protein
LNVADLAKAKTFFNALFNIPIAGEWSTWVRLVSFFVSSLSFFLFFFGSILFLEQVEYSTGNTRFSLCEVKDKREGDKTTTKQIGVCYPTFNTKDITAFHAKAKKLEVEVVSEPQQQPWYSLLSLSCSCSY